MKWYATDFIITWAWDDQDDPEFVCEVHGDDASETAAIMVERMNAYDRLTTERDEWEAVARVLASTIVTARIRWPELRHPMDVPDRAEDIWLTWARDQVKP